MVQQLESETKSEIIYPESDGKPMADNTKQFRWIVLIKENLEILFAENPDVFIAGDLLWYPQEGSQGCQAPDAMVVFGRPKGDRSSYKQWKESNIAPQVVFEILSPSNTVTEMSKKLLFYQQHGVEEYYIYDPDGGEFVGMQRREGQLQDIQEVNGWVSPRLGIKFEIAENTLKIYRPDGRQFLTPLELDQLREQERIRAEQERLRAEQERTRAEQERIRADEAAARVKLLEARLRSLGIDPEQM
ncbi:MAG: Uma2 family endonuclease [Oscillatoriaceae cyanobacterium]